MKYFYIILFLALSGCPSINDPLQPTIAPVPKDTDWCGNAGENLEIMQCKDLRGDPMWVNRKGVYFKSTCEEAQEDGRIFLDPKCITNAKTCEEAKKCST